MTGQNIGNEPIIVFLAKKKILLGYVETVTSPSMTVKREWRDAITERPEDYPTDYCTKHYFIGKGAAKSIPSY